MYQFHLKKPALTNTGIYYLQEKLMWNKEDENVVNNIAKIFDKSMHINKWFSSVALTETTDCTMLMVWNRFYMNWVTIPCNEQVLDKGSLFCVNNTQTGMKFRSTDLSLNYTNPKDIFNTFMCSNSYYISSLMLCNDELDCEHGEDEVLCKDKVNNIFVDDILNCKFHELPDFQFINTNRTTFSKMKHCFTEKQESLKTLRVTNKSTFTCFDKEIKCIYEITETFSQRVLSYCINGTHLDFCEDFNCKVTYKCPGYYCVPWRYVCDGHWDCPFGYDESDCSVTKPGFYHCTNTSINIDLSNVCDDILDCPDGSDEQSCILQNIECPSQCTCLIYTTICNQSSVLYDGIELPHAHLFLSNESNLQIFLSFLAKFHALTLIHLTGNYFPHFCVKIMSTVLPVQSMLAPDNNILEIDDGCFSAIPNVTLLSLANNKISRIKCNVFVGTELIEFFTISRNRLSYLQSCTFKYLLKLKLLDLLHNNIKIIQKDILKYHFETNLFIRSSFFAFCCLKPTIHCTASAVWPESCKSMLLLKSVRVTNWVVSALGVILIIVLLLVKNGSQIYAYNMIVKGINFSDICYILMLIYLAAADLYYGNSFVFVSSNWRKSLPCHFLSILTLFSTFLIMLSKVIITLLRYLLVYFPLNNKFRQGTLVFRIFCTGFFVCILISVLLSVFSLKFSKNQQGSRVCYPIMDNGHPMPPIFLTIYMILCGITSTVMYILIVLKLHNQPNIRSTHSNRSNVYPKVKAIVAIIFDLMFWLPTSIVIIVTLIRREYPYDVLIWTIVIIRPMNIFVNPFLYQINIKEVMKKV